MVITAYWVVYPDRALPIWVGHLSPAGVSGHHPTPGPDRGHPAPIDKSTEQSSSNPELATVLVVVVCGVDIRVDEYILNSELLMLITIWFGLFCGKTNRCDDVGITSEAYSYHVEQ